ncbi:MAG: sugar ABC transporter permease [Chloroflexi bacterium]|nr:sugar ABC transporter permease [Chloroflexota bacterium]
MATTQDLGLTTQPQQSQEGHPTSMLLVLVWQVIASLILVAITLQLWQIETFFDLGVIVPRFIGAVVLLAAVAGIVIVPLLYRMQNSGRLGGIIFNFFGFTLGLLLLGHLLGLYIGIDDLAAGLYSNAILILGFPVGYGVVMIGRRLDPMSAAFDWIQRAGLGIMMLTLLILLISVGLADSLGTLVNGLFRLDVLATIGALAAFMAAGVVLLRQGERFGETINQREAWQGWLFLLPNFANFMLFFALPLLLSFYMSLTDFDAVSAANFIGIENYTDMLSLDFQTINPLEQAPAEVLRARHFEIGRITFSEDSALIIGARDPLFWLSLGNTIRYCVMLLILSIVPALGLAMLLNSKIPGMRFFRAVYFLPSIAAVVGVALIWQWLYDPVIGYINYTLGQIATFFGGESANILWLTDESIMLISAVIMAAWQVIGFNTVILLAGLQNVPRELIEAATVDGANGWTRFRKIIMPLLAPTTFFVTVTTLILGLQAFSELFVLFGNSTSNARLTTVFYLYQQGFETFNMGYASAIAWVLFGLIFIVTLIQFRLSSNNAAYSD